MTSERSTYDVVVVGAGHNGLVAAGYLARAGLSVLVLERLAHVGGAAVSAVAFPGQPARLSRYADLVSLLPQQLVSELDLDLELLPRATSSYTPTLRGGAPGGLLVERPEGAATAESFRTLTGGDDDHAAWQAFRAGVGDLARVVAPTLLDPLPTERSIRDQVDAEVWHDVVLAPIGEAIERRFADDTVRGVVAADALVGTFASLHDPSLVQNRCFLYHLLGNGTGEWRVPVGGMGAVTAALARSATDAGAEVITSAGVSRIEAVDEGAEVTWHDGRSAHTITARHVLAQRRAVGAADPHGRGRGRRDQAAGFAAQDQPVARPAPAAQVGRRPRGRVRRQLPGGRGPLRARARVRRGGRRPRAVHGAGRGHLPLAHRPVGPRTGPRRHAHPHLPRGPHPGRAVRGDDRDAVKALAVERALAALDEHLAEPIESCVSTDASGRPCIEAFVPQDVEADLAMPGGHIFHGDLDWPWAANRARLETPAQQWGVQTGVASVMVCGSGARRGGAVSGLGGHNAARAVLGTR